MTASGVTSGTGPSPDADPPQGGVPRDAPSEAGPRAITADQPAWTRLRWAASDAAVVTGRNLRHFVRQPQLLLFSTVQPVMFVLLFAFVFDGAIDVPTDDYLQYLLPGIFVQSVAFRAAQTAVGLAEDLDRGVIDRFRTLPMARSAVLAGRTFADLARNVFIVLLMAGVGLALGFRFETNPWLAVAAILMVSLFGYALSWVFAYVGLRTKGAEAAQSAGFVVMFPLVFASSVFVPVESMPGWLATFASWSPITHAADAARALSIGSGPALPPTLLSLTSIAVVLAVFVPLSVRAYRRAR